MSIRGFSRKSFFVQKFNCFFTITQKVLVAELQILVYRDPHQIYYKIGENSVQIGQIFFSVFPHNIKKFLVFFAKIQKVGGRSS